MPISHILKASDAFGFVYILSNKWMQGIVKIGKTQDIVRRIKTLSDTNVPEAFKAEYISKVKKEKMDDAEKTLHAVFAEFRVNPKREFFLWDDEKEDTAIRILKLIEIENVTDEVNAELMSSLSADEVIAMKSNDVLVQRARRPNLDFNLLGIKDGEHLYWKDDHTKFVTVCSARKIIYNGKECYLTTATKDILGTDAPTAPSPYWLYKGKTIKEIYDKVFEPTDGTEYKDETDSEE